MVVKAFSTDFPNDMANGVRNGKRRTTLLYVTDASWVALLE
jgi:hypothetical protein